MYNLCASALSVVAWTLHVHFGKHPSRRWDVCPKKGDRGFTLGLFQPTLTLLTV